MRKVICLSFAFMLTLVFASFAAAQEAQDKPPDRAQGMLNEAKALIDKGQFDEAIVALDEAIKISPDMAALYHQLGRAYANKYYKTRDSAFELKARDALQKAIELDHGLAEAYFLLGRIEFFNKQYEAAVADYERTIIANPEFTGAYTEKWATMMKRTDFEMDIPKIRQEIEGLLMRAENRQAMLHTAATGYSIIADIQGVRRIQDLLLAEFPDSKSIERILYGRIVEEKDNLKRAALIEPFVARYPQNTYTPSLYRQLFSIRLLQPGTPNERIIEIADAWVKAATKGALEAGKNTFDKANKSAEMIGARTLVMFAFAERRLELERAQAMDYETLRLIDEIRPDIKLGNGFNAARRDAALEKSKQDVRTARAFVLLKRGRVADAASELSSTLQDVIKEVDNNGYILWKDMYLREVGVRPRVLWLAELYEAQGDYKRAAKYLLAGYGDDERGNKFIRERLPVVYQKMGRSQSEAAAAIKLSESRYHSLTEDKAFAKAEQKRRVLADRVGTPAADFKVEGIDNKKIQLSALKGKVVVVNFWATWCGPCVAEMPHLQKVVDQYKNQPDVFFLAISIDESRAAVLTFMEKYGYHMVAAYDDDAYESYKVHGVPTTFIIDRNGTIQFREIGFGDEGKEYIERMTWRVDELLKEKPAPPPAGKDKGQKQN
jgi:thiol-disulfide isomerase/thioredoxin/Flp pilus assembly protein TadD